MIPVRLELKNFMSYGSNVEPLDFHGIHIACLSGENGHGKSALLDAITWALWGEARASADELIRMGADEMRVTFEFMLGDELYRVIRGRSKRKSSSVWEIYISENPSEPENWRPISGQGIRDTGRAIQRILRMDYKTFINSAYIQQGRADEFTKQSVSDRKKILADILDLARYDALEQKAKVRRNDADQRVTELEREIGAIEVELQGEEGFRKELSESQSRREELEDEIAKAEKELSRLQSRLTELNGRQSRIDEIKSSISGWETELRNLESRKADQEKRIARNRDVISKRDEILAAHEKLNSLREMTARLERILEEVRGLEHEKAGLEQQIKSEEHRLALEKNSLSRQLADVEAKIAKASRIENEAKSLREQVKEFDELEANRSKLSDEVSELSDKLGALKSQHDSLAENLKPELAEKLRLISEPGAKCPLCQTDLGELKHEKIVADYNRQIEETDRRIQELRKQGNELKSKRDSSKQQIAKIDQRLKEGHDIRGRLAQTEQLLEQMNEQRNQIPEIQQKFDIIQRKLKCGEFAQEERNRLNEIMGKIAAHAYDPDSHRKAKDEFAGLEECEAKAMELRHAESNLPSDEANLKGIEELSASRSKSISDGRKAIAELSESLSELPTLNAKIGEISNSLLSMRNADREITGRIATLEHSLKRCESLKAEVSEKRGLLDTARKDKAVYTELVGVFGKRGVQALIIENAIPEIQEEANRLLSKMTDNAMQIFIETVRDKKTGGAAETLEIKVSDDMGSRNYELFSGGEAFRINFALRIALSKLLARRAGARLQTLIIDEKFGSQDAKGREKLVEAIDSISDDFELILAITHIDELRDAFPTRIEVTKDSRGSQISLN